MKNSILSTSNLSIGYTTKKETIVIAENLNLKLQEGKLIALIGANGIGKSTLLRTLTGIQKPISGSVILNTKNLNDLGCIELEIDWHRVIGIHVTRFHIQMARRHSWNSIKHFSV